MGRVRRCEARRRSSTHALLGDRARPLQCRPARAHHGVWPHHRRTYSATGSAGLHVGCRVRQPSLLGYTFRTYGIPCGMGYDYAVTTRVLLALPLRLPQPQCGAAARMLPVACCVLCVACCVLCVACCMVYVACSAATSPSAAVRRRCSRPSWAHCCRAGLAGKVPPAMPALALCCIVASLSRRMLVACMLHRLLWPSEHPTPGTPAALGHAASAPRPSSHEPCDCRRLPVGRLLLRLSAHTRSLASLRDASDASARGSLGACRHIRFLSAVRRRHARELRCSAGGVPRARTAASAWHATRS